jgi:hypothetical protein
MYKIVEGYESGKTYLGCDTYDYLIEDKYGKRKWLYECIYIDIDLFSDEDWEMLDEEVKFG